MREPILRYVLVVVATTTILAGNSYAQVASWIEGAFPEITRHRVDLAAIPIIELSADAELESSDPDESDDLLLGSSLGVARLGDTLFVADRDQNVVLVGDLRTNYFVDSFGSPGEGPGEFGAALDVLVSGDRVYVFDSRRRGVHVFDLGFQEIAFLRTGLAFWNQFALAGNHLIVRSQDGDDQLFEVRQRVPPFMRVGSLGKAVPERFPSAWGYNQALVAANNRGNIVFAWNGQPVVVAHNSDMEATDLISFDGLDACSRNDAYQERVYRCFLALKMDDASNIYVTFKHYVLRLSGWREGRPVATVYALSDGESNVSAYGLDVNGNELYVGSIHAAVIYRFTIPGG